MQNLEFKDAIHKIKKTKCEIKKELEESIANGGRNENTDIQEKAKNCTSEEDPAKVIQEFEGIIKNKKGDIVWLAYYQGKMFQKFKEKKRFVSKMVLKFEVSKSTIVFKIALSRLIDDYPKIKDSSLSVQYFLENLKMITEVCRVNASKFK